MICMNQMMNCKCCFFNISDLNLIVYNEYSTNYSDTVKFMRFGTQTLEFLKKFNNIQFYGHTTTSLLVEGLASCYYNMNWCSHSQKYCIIIFDNTQPTAFGGKVKNVSFEKFRRTTPIQRTSEEFITMLKQQSVHISFIYPSIEITDSFKNVIKNTKSVIGNSHEIKNDYVNLLLRKFKKSMLLQSLLTICNQMNVLTKVIIVNHSKTITNDDLKKTLPKSFHLNEKLPKLNIDFMKFIAKEQIEKIQVLPTLKPHQTERYNSILTTLNNSQLFINVNLKIEKYSIVHLFLIPNLLFETTFKINQPKQSYQYFVGVFITQNMINNYLICKKNEVVLATINAQNHKLLNIQLKK